MKIAHVGPALARRGGPAGYLLQLAQAAEMHAGERRHQVTFPPVATPAPLARQTWTARARAAMRPIKRALVGPPTFHRPADGDLRRRGGSIDALMTASMQAVCVDAAESIAAAIQFNPDVLFAHDVGVAERLLEIRRPDQQVWLLMHAPMPIGLDLPWSWGVPEWTWEALAALPDVQHWMEWELGVCSQVDRLVTPCEEAVSELARVDRRFAALPFEYVLTGAAGRARRFPDETRAQLRTRWRLPSDAPVGLFLSSPLPYRGFDRLIEAVAAVPATVPGVIAIAGGTRGTAPSHPRLRLLGHVQEVSDLLHAVDFIVNVNRFSLFDLSTIEAAQAGLPMLLHATGGNIRFARLGVGCESLDDLDVSTIARGLEHFFTMSDAARRALADASRRCYERHLRPEHLWARHHALYDAAAADASARRDTGVRATTT